MYIDCKEVQSLVLKLWAQIGDILPLEVHVYIEKGQIIKNDESWYILFIVNSILLQLKTRCIEKAINVRNHCYLIPKTCTVYCTHVVQ